MSIPRHALNKIGKHIFWLTPDHSTDRPILGAIVGRDGTLLVDAGASPDHARTFLRFLAAERITPTHLMLTHWHWDHLFGIDALKLPTFAQVHTKQQVVQMAAWAWDDASLDARVAAGEEIAFCRDMLKLEMPDRSRLMLRVPELGFVDEVQLRLGGVTAVIQHVGGDHAGDSSVVFVPEARVAFVGDALYQDLYHAPPRYTNGKLFPLLEKLLAFDADSYVQSHHDEPTSREGLETLAKQLRRIGRLVEIFEGDKTAVLAALPPVDEETDELIDAFVVGWRSEHDH